MGIVPSTIVNYESPEYWYKTIFRDKSQTPKQVVDKMIIDMQRLATSIEWVTSYHHKFRSIRSKPDLQKIIDRMIPLEKTALWSYLHEVATDIRRNKVARIVIYKHYSHSLSSHIFNMSLARVTRILEKVQTKICDVLFCAIMTGLLPKELEIKLPRDPCDLRFKDEKEITVLVELIRECASVLRQARRDEQRILTARTAPPITQSQKGRPPKVLTEEEWKMIEIVEHWERWRQDGKSKKEFCQQNAELLAEYDLDRKSLNNLIKRVREWRKTGKLDAR